MALLNCRSLYSVFTITFGLIWAFIVNLARIFCKFDFCAAAHVVIMNNDTFAFALPRPEARLLVHEHDQSNIDVSSRYWTATTAKKTNKNTKKNAHTCSPFTQFVEWRINALVYSHSGNCIVWRPVSSLCAVQSIRYLRSVVNFCTQWEEIVLSALQNFDACALWHVCNWKKIIWIAFTPDEFAEMHFRSQGQIRHETQAALLKSEFRIMKNASRKRNKYRSYFTCTAAHCQICRSRRGILPFVHIARIAVPI